MNQLPKQRKYIFVNGVMKLNPKFNMTAATAATQSTPSSDSNPNISPTVSMTTPSPIVEPLQVTPEPVSTTSSPIVEPLQVISSLDDIAQATDAQSDDAGVSMTLAESTIQAMVNTQGDDFISQLNGSISDSNVVLEGLTNLFNEFKIPIGMISKLQALAAYRLNFMIDDSGSMR